jgi:DNA uptake protein ComE-like DNA-binding protein
MSRWSRTLRHALRYISLAVVAIGLVISIKACSSPTVQSSPVASVANSTTNSSADSNTAPSGQPKININSAILSALDKLEAQLGVPALSNKIQASRPYANIEELVSKKVVTQAQFDQIKDQITIAETVLTGVAKDVDYVHKLALMKGHMLVAGELLALGKPEQAVPHLGHPVEEIYVDVADQLSERQVPEFKAELTKVQDLVNAKPNDPQVKAEYDRAIAAIDKAINAIPQPQRQTPSFALKVINNVFDTAAAEYAAAIANGKIKETIEYQDSRGFVTYAQDTLYKAIEGELKAKDATVSQKLTTTMTALRKAWPTPVPPAAPVLTVDEVVGKVKAIEQATAPMTQSPST